MTYAKQNATQNYFQTDNLCCMNQKITTKDGYYVCANCGTIISKIIKNYPKGNFSQYERNTRRQNEKVFTPVGPRTIFKAYRDGNGNTLSPDSHRKFRRLAKINRGLRTSLERNLWIALPKFNILKKKLQLPDYVSEEAYKIYLECVKEKITLGRGIENVLAASFYTAIKIYKIPRSVEEITKAAQITKKDLIKTFSAINQEILPLINLQLKVISSRKYVIRFNKELKLSMECLKEALQLINRCKQNGMRTSGKDPKGYAAAAIYMCAKEVNDPRTQKEICEVSSISEVTLRNRIKDLQLFS